MQQHKPGVCFLLTIAAIGMSSCATMFNSADTRVKIITTQPVSMVVNGDTVANGVSQKQIIVKRNNKPLTVTVTGDSISKTVHVKPVNSFAYWLNAYPNWHLWTGFIIDTKTKKRFTYPKNVYIDTQQSDSSYLTYNTSVRTHSNVLKLSLSALSNPVNPGIELSYERKIHARWSSQVMMTWLLPGSLLNSGNDIDLGIKGYRIGFEQKYYFRRTAPRGMYASAECSFLQNNYTAQWNFGVENITDTSYHNTNYPDDFDVSKKTYTFNLKSGYQLFYKSWSMDLSAGIGLRYKDVRHFNRINPQDQMEWPRHPNIFYITNREGKYWTVSLPLQVKIGWSF